jgi:hypothetical protein
MADGAIFDNVVEHVLFFRIRSVVRLRHPELDAAAILNKEARLAGAAGVRQQLGKNGRDAVLLLAASKLLS